MTEIDINLTISLEGDILIECGEKNYSINFDDKTINAQKVYDLLNYKSQNRYTIKSNIDSVQNMRIKEYFEDVINLMKNIKDDINELSNNQIDDIEESDTIDDYLNDLN